VSGSGAASLFGPSSTSSPPVLHIDYDLRKSLAEINSMLATNVANWLKKRGKVSTVCSSSRSTVCMLESHALQELRSSDTQSGSQTGTRIPKTYPELGLCFGAVPCSM
jgi:hypothetical protein